MLNLILIITTCSFVRNLTKISRQYNSDECFQHICGIVRLGLLILNIVNICKKYWSHCVASDMLSACDFSFCFRGGSPAGAGEDGCSADPLLRAKSEQPGCAAEAGAGPGGLQSLYLQPGGPPPVAGPHWEGAPGGSRSADTCWRCSTMRSWETEGNVSTQSYESVRHSSFKGYLKICMQICIFVTSSCTYLHDASFYEKKK